MNVRVVVIAGLGASLALGALASCASEDVHTTALVLQRSANGSLSGFDCIEKDSIITARDCLQQCHAACVQGCRDEGAARRDAGAGEAVALAEMLGCTQRCLSAGTCSDRCTVTSTGEEGRPLAARANGREVCLVVDFLRFEEEAECRSLLNLLELCAAQADRCGLVARRVRCGLDLQEVPADAGMTAATTALHARSDAVLAALREDLPVVSNDATRGRILVRVAATTEGEDALTRGDPLDLDEVVGCSVSCPVQLQHRDLVTLALDEGLPRYCREGTVRGCAAIGGDQLREAIDTAIGD